MKDAVYISFSNDLIDIPVLDKDGKFLGIIDHEILLKIFNKEMGKNFLQFGGLFHKVGDEYTSIKSSSLHMIKSRLPWLLIGVIGGILSASVVSHFESLLSSYIALAAFIPIMVYMSDAAGTQSEALVIRALALDSNLDIRYYLLREIKVAFIIGLISGAFAGLISAVSRGIPVLGLIIGIAMFLSILCSVLIATVSPAIFKKINLDPAVATGPLATIVSDITTLLIYFGVAVLLLGSL